MTSPLATISPLVQRLRLASDIARLRTAAGFTQSGLAKAIGQARQAVTRLENPLTNLERGITGDHVRSILIACGVHPDQPEHHRVMELMWSARSEGWWERGHPQMGGQQKLIADIELGATVIREYHPYLPPGLTQTEAFARERAGVLTLEDATIDGLVAGRLQRQRATLDRDDLTYHVVLEEMAVRRSTAPPEILAEQLLHLVKLAERPRFSVRVLPLAAPLGEGKAPTSPCSIYTYPDPEDPQITVIDTFLRDHIIVDPGEVSMYSQLSDRLRDASLSDADSAAFIRRAADDLLQGRRAA